jgi:hypothetical protein
MFEEKMNSRRLAAVRQHREQGETLRLLSWEELRARLSAARDLRRTLLAHNERDGSFAADAALHLKEFDDPIPDVNPKPLGNRKGSESKTGKTRQQASSDDRGQDD